MSSTCSGVDLGGFATTRWIRNKKVATAEWLMDGRDARGRRLLVGVLSTDRDEGVRRAVTAREVGR
jgi:hypothetical protein